MATEQLPPTPFGSASFCADERELLSTKLARKLPPECISNRSGGAGKMSYLEGWRAIELANEIFGFDAWSSQVVSQTVDFVDCADGKWSVGIQAMLRITLKDGCFHEDAGYGLMENSRSKGQAFEKARKEAITDALKRTLRLFGNSLGNCLGDKDYLRQVTNVPSRTDKPSMHSNDTYQPHTLTRTTSIPQQTSWVLPSAQPTHTNNVSSVPIRPSIIQNTASKSASMINHEHSSELRQSVSANATKKGLQAQSRPPYKQTNVTPTNTTVPPCTNDSIDFYSSPELPISPFVHAAPELIPKKHIPEFQGIKPPITQLPVAMVSTEHQSHSNTINNGYGTITPTNWAASNAYSTRKRDPLEPVDNLWPKKLVIHSK